MSGNEETNGSNGNKTGNGNGNGGVIEGAKPETDKKEGTPAVPAKPDGNPTPKAKDGKDAKTAPKGKKDGKDGKDGKDVKAVKAMKASKPPKASGGKKKDKAAKGAKAVKADNKGKGGKAVKTINAKLEVTDGCPYRETSSYGKLWTLLHKNREKGISRADFIKQGAKIVGKDEKHTAYDVAVVASPTKDGTAHPSANRAADHYWIERTEGGLLKLHLRK